MALLALAWLAVPALAQAGGVVISEVMYRPAGTPGGTWLELYNRGGAAVDLTGWSILVNDGADALAGTIPPGGYFLIAASATVCDGIALCGDHYVVADGLIGKGLAEGGAYVALRDPGGRVVDALSYGANRDVCPHPSSADARESLQLADLSLPAFSCAYAPAAPGPWAAPLPAPTPTPTAAAGSVLLTEVAYLGDCGAEWVELYNPGAGAVTLAGWSLADAQATVALPDLTLAPGAVAVVGGSGASVEPSCAAAKLSLGGRCIGNGLADGGDAVSLLDAGGRAIDAVAYGTGLAAPPGASLARLLLADGGLADWAAGAPAPGCLQAAPEPPPPTPTVAPAITPTPVATNLPQTLPLQLVYLPAVGRRAADGRSPVLLISEVLYDGATGDEGDEFVELRNFTATAIPLSGYRLGDAERAGDGEGMYLFPEGAALPASSLAVVARCAASYAARFAARPAFEFRPAGCPDSPDVPDMVRDGVWGRGSFALADSGDEVLLLAPDATPIDAFAYGSGDFTAAGLTGDARAAEPLSLQRVTALDADDMSLDCAREAPSPGLPLDLPSLPAPAVAPAWQGLYCFWGGLHAHTSASDGAGPAELAFARARAAGLHFYAITDHDHLLRPVEWSRTLAAAGRASEPGAFVALPGTEWTSRDQGHVNVFGATDVASRDYPATADLAGLYVWLAAHGAVGQFNHPGLGGAYGGDQPAPASAPVRLLEVGNGSGVGKDYRLFEDELLQAWRNGWRVAPAIGPDTHTTAWGTDTAARTGLWAESLTPEALLDAIAAGRAFASEDANAALAWRCGGAWMGGEASEASTCLAYYVDGGGEPAVLRALAFDGALLGEWAVASGAEQPLAWAGVPEGVWLRLTQADGDVLWAAPIWFALAP